MRIGHRDSITASPGNECDGATVAVRPGSIKEAAIQIIEDSTLNVTRPIGGQRGDSGAFACGVRHDFVFLKQKPEVDDPKDDEQQQRKYEGKLDELRTRFGTSTADSAYDRSHTLTRSPAKIGMA